MCINTSYATNAFALILSITLLIPTNRVRSVNTSTMLPLSVKGAWEGWEEITEEPGGYRKFLMDYAAIPGIPQRELDYLHRAGVSDFEM